MSCSRSVLDLTFRIIFVNFCSHLFRKREELTSNSLKHWIFEPGPLGLLPTVEGKIEFNRSKSYKILSYMKFWDTDNAL